MLSHEPSGEPPQPPGRAQCLADQQANDVPTGSPASRRPLDKAIGSVHFEICQIIKM